MIPFKMIYIVCLSYLIGSQMDSGGGGGGEGGGHSEPPSSLILLKCVFMEYLRPLI